MAYTVEVLPVTETAAETLTPNQKLRAKRAINRQLYDMGFNTYYDSLGEVIDTIGDMLINAGLDPTPLGGMYCGADGRIHEHVGNNLWLTLGWHKMDVSGRYEITAYLS